MQELVFTAQRNLTEACQVALQDRIFGSETALYQINTPQVLADPNLFAPDLTKLFQEAGW